MADWRLPRNRSEFRVLLSFVADTYGTALVVIALAAPVAAVVGVVAGLRSYVSDLAAGLIVGGSLGLGLGVSLAVAIRYVRKAERTRLHGYVYDSASYVYTISDNGSEHHSHEIELELRAIRDSVRYVLQRWAWTGKGDEDPPRIVSDAHRIAAPPKLNRRWMEYHVDLGRSLARGERETIKIEQDLLDAGHEMHPFLAKVVREPIESSLKLTMRFPSDRLPHLVEGYTYRSGAIDAEVIEKVRVAVDRGTGQASWEVSRPRHWRRYSLEWVYADGRGVYGD